MKMGRKARRGGGKGGKKKRGKKSNTTNNDDGRAIMRRNAVESLRFSIGSRVECFVGDASDDRWITATVVKLLYDTEFDIGIVPYQLQCDDGALRFAPYDNEYYLRPSNSPPMPIKFSPGTRVNIKYCATMDWKLGTIISANEDWADDIDWSTEKDIMSKNAPYEITFDDDNLVRGFFGPVQWITYSAPPMPVQFDEGARVECRMPNSEDWSLGTIISATKDWVEQNYSPYYIHFDDDTWKNFYGPEEDIREAELRFKVGDRVERESNSNWIPGTIVKLWPDGCNFWGENKKVPYEWRLDDGSLEYIPDDTDDFIRKSKVPPLNVKHSTGARVECKLKGADVWRQGTIVRSNEDWAEHNRPPYFIRFVDNGDPQYSEFYGPDDHIRECTLSTLTASFKNLDLFDPTDNDDLFASPPMKSDCPICFIPIPVECDEYVNMPCCGNLICAGCSHALRNGKGSSGACAFCRTPIANENEFLAQSRKRMELDDAEITFCMGCYYSSGSHGLPKDKKKAFELFLRAAELGSARACTNVAIAYRTGVLVERNESKHIHYLSKAAKLGEVRGRYNLALAEESKGNIELALRHWKIAAAQGSSAPLPHILESYQRGMLSKDEYTDILRACQRAKDAEWSRDREIAKKSCC